MDKKSYWQKIIDDQIKSGLSVERYCVERNLNHHTFKYWKTKNSVKPPPKMSSNFLPVRVQKAQEGFTVKFSSGQMTFSTEPNPTWFAKVLKEMGREECR